MGSSVLWAIVVLSALASIGFMFLFIKETIDAGKQTKYHDFDQILHDSGYAYDERQNIFYSRKDAWQRKYGYCQTYDEAAALFSMIFDCESIRFRYGNKNWLIEVWKGQYGITTGCEIGVYTKEGQELNVPGVYDFTLYDCAGSEDLLPMVCYLRRNNEILFSRSDTHWWLTGFMLGEFSEPSELEMLIAITLKSYEMCQAFVNGLKEIGYSDLEIKIRGNTVGFLFSRPRSPQPASRKLLGELQQKKNKFMCEKYRELAKNYPALYKTTSAARQKEPELYRLITSVGRPEELFKQHKPS